MNIRDVITIHYNELYDMLRKKDLLISECKTEEDHLQDICLRAMNKYKDMDITEEEGLAYLTKTLLMTFTFRWKKTDSNTVYLSDLPDTMQFPDPDFEF